MSQGVLGLETEVGQRVTTEKRQDRKMAKKGRQESIRGMEVPE